MASELLGAVGIVEATLAFTIYPIQELWQSREDAAAARAAKDPPFTPLPSRLWGRLLAVALVGYTAALATRGRGRLEAHDPVVGPFETRGAITARFLGGFAVGVPYFYLVAVVLGAPLWGSIDATLALAVLLSLLVSAPLAAAAHSLDQLRLPPFYQGPPTEAPLVRARAMGAALGAWLGATLIPLDWAMPFQEYPLPPVAGAVLGHNLGTLGWCLYEQLLSRSTTQQQQRRVRFD